MPKRRRVAKIIKRNKSSKIRREILQKQLTLIQRGKENNIVAVPESARLTADNDPLLTFMKIEVKEEDLRQEAQLDYNPEINIPLKIEKYESLDCARYLFNIKEEQHSDNENTSSLSETSNKDLNILIEWALNLQFDHSQKCSGRLYPCKEIFDNFRCKIVVLYCTVCKKRMLHTLKDWAML